MNLPGWLFGKSAKFSTGVIGQALTFAVAYYGGTNRWVTLAVAVAAALGVYAVPNQGAAARIAGSHRAAPLEDLPEPDYGGGEFGTPPPFPGVHDE